MHYYPSVAGEMTESIDSLWKPIIIRAEVKPLSVAICLVAWLHLLYLNWGKTTVYVLVGSQFGHGRPGSWEGAVEGGEAQRLVAAFVPLTVSSSFWVCEILSSYATDHWDDLRFLCSQHRVQTRKDEWHHPRLRGPCNQQSSCEVWCWNYRSTRYCQNYWGKSFH